MENSDFTRIQIQDAIRIPEKDGIYTVYTNRWWAVEGESILIYRDHSPQCNSSKQLVDHLVAAPNHPARGARHIDRVFLVHKC